MIFWFLSRFFWRSQRGFLLFMTVISYIGIAIGVAALILVIGVMNGFDSQLKEKIMSSNPNIIIEGDEPIPLSEDLIKEIESVDGVESAEPFVYGQVFLRHGNRILAVYLRGIGPSGSTQISFADRLIAGAMPLGAEGIAIGIELAKRLGLGLGDEVILLSPVDQAEYRFRCAAIFKTGMYDIDANMVIVDLNVGEEMFWMEGHASAIAVKLAEPMRAPQIAGMISRLKEVKGMYIRTWIDANRSLFAALKLEKIAMFFILLLIVIVASFNIISSQVVLVTEKTREIGILRALGFTRGEIFAVFTLLGGYVGFIGAVSGAVLGSVLGVFADKYQLIKLPSDIYYINYMPVLIDARTVVFIAATAVVIAFVSSLYPAYSAARLVPASALRYE